MEKMLLDGEMRNRSEIKVEFEDRGYQFGDGVYEVIRVYNGKLFTSEMHLTRLIESANKISIKIPYTVEEIEAQLKELVAENEIAFGTVYMQFTRGVSPRNHPFPSTDVAPVYVAYTKEVPYNGALKPGAKAITIEDIRWLRCDIKSLNLLGNILAKQKAAETGCFEAIQHRGSTVTEGSSSNISIVVNGELKTHPATNLILNGITRQVMLKICEDLGVAYKEEAFTLEELVVADEVIMTSTTAEITPITEIDGQSIGSGEPGTVTRQIQQAFHAELERQCGHIIESVAK
ncbi:D-amino-acid transaminase [Peribacillus loiseleuriae]|uniref:D-alanine aminotransferase n=1 Tax=Peribacillus loiseleuriae TaxID=1679170 RepID=A0A0K9GYI2_9BACI|nr:D-amino-acid transaminase [Peribacillus loiseleuriae]KMY51307.1 D-alanine aminotransferase [Peribacillus loiseleuriae]